MNFQTIIIGGGLSGLTAGIALARAGQKVAIVSSGQSALHFGSGTFELLALVNGKPVDNPIEAIDSLSDCHPYKKIGAARVKELADRVKPMFGEAGLKLKGTTEKNHYRLTPFGKVKSGWLSMTDFATFDKADKLPWHKVALVNIKNLLDFYPQFLASGMSKLGTETVTGELTIPQLERLRTSPSEMRAPNIARVVGEKEIDLIADEINRLTEGVDAAFMPACIGLYGTEKVELLRSKVNRELYFITTMPTSVPGVRAQLLLHDYFVRLGGTYLLGDTVTDGKFNGSRLENITTANHGDMALCADNFILATGSFFSHGLTASPNKIYETIFGFDVNASDNRAEWYDKDIYASQPFMSYGVETDDCFRVKLNGKTISNVYASGSVTGGCNPLKEGCGAGIAIITALDVADRIMEKAE